MKGLMKEFKEFITKGDVLSMAIGLIIGSAFTAIVTSLNTNILTPLIGMVFGGIDLSTLSVTVGEAELLYGAFLQSIINFLITALVLFFLLKGFNKLSDAVQKEKKEAEATAPAAPPEPSEEVKLLTEISTSK